MILPLTHERMTVQRLPWITIGIIAVNLIVFLLSWPRVRRDQANLIEILEEIREFGESRPGMAEEEFESADDVERYKTLVARYEEAARGTLFGRFGFVPSSQEWADLVSSLFLHAGWWHLIGNMYLLWLCGCSIEDVWGRPLYTVFYIAGGAAAAVTHAWTLPDSPVPLVGASGAIAGVMGAFLVRLYKTRIRFFYWYFIHMGTFFAPAGVMLPLWLISQLFYAFVFADQSPVAFWAHVGGFAFGVAAALWLRLALVEEAFLAPAIEKKTTLFTQHRGVKAALDCMDAGRYQDAVRHLQEALRENPEDIDALRLLAQGYQGLGKPAEAAQAWRRNIRAHLKRQEKDLAADAYLAMLEVSPESELPPREMLSVASALAQTDQYREAVALYRRLLGGQVEPLLRLKASLALADLYEQDHKKHLALEVLRSVSPLADTMPEWSLHIQAKTRELTKKP